MPLGLTSRLFPGSAAILAASAEIAPPPMPAGSPIELILGTYVHFNMY